MTALKPRLWRVIGTVRCSGQPASIIVQADRDVLSDTAKRHPWFRPGQARTVRADATPPRTAAP